MFNGLVHFLRAPQLFDEFKLLTASGSSMTFQRLPQSVQETFQLLAYHAMKKAHRLAADTVEDALIAGACEYALHILSSGHGDWRISKRGGQDVWVNQAGSPHEAENLTLNLDFAQATIRAFLVINGRFSKSGAHRDRFEAMLATIQATLQGTVADREQHDSNVCACPVPLRAALGTTDTADKPGYFCDLKAASSSVECDGSKGIKELEELCL